jgi:hypothetical protein
MKLLVESARTELGKPSNTKKAAQKLFHAATWMVEETLATLGDRPVDTLLEQVAGPGAAFEAAAALTQSFGVGDAAAMAILEAWDSALNVAQLLLPAEFPLGRNGTPLRPYARTLHLQARGAGRLVQQALALFPQFLERIRSAVGRLRAERAPDPAAGVRALELVSTGRRRATEAAKTLHAQKAWRAFSQLDRAVEEADTAIATLVAELFRRCGMRARPDCDPAGAVERLFQTLHPDKFPNKRPRIERALAELERLRSDVREGLIPVDRDRIVTGLDAARTAVTELLKLLRNEIASPAWTVVQHAAWRMLADRDEWRVIG